MARARAQFACQNCGSVTSRWQGRCESCGEWNAIVEEPAAGGGVAGGPAGNVTPLRRGRIIDLLPLAGETPAEPRSPVGIGEFDRVTGGGFVPGSALLVGGDPGIGKSTLLIQASAALARRGGRVVYISGEESVAQVRLRAGRLGLAEAPVQLAAETSVEDILTTLSAGSRPDLLILDSIQTLWTAAADAAPGTVIQVRAAAQAMIRHAKLHGTAVVFVGHVTKDGQIAGPRVVEHMVDAVLYFEGDAGHRFRILRAVKNRFGPAEEIGVFEMTSGGLAEVANPSELFLSDRNLAAPGAAVFAGLEGSRPVLCEIQALVAPSAPGTPRRAVVGWDAGRLAMILAVLESRCGVRIGANDIYLNVAGGLRIVEPAADLAVAAALVSSLLGVTLPPDAVHFGEISLSGAVRPVAGAPARLKEAERLGFSRAMVPTSTAREGAGPRMTGLPDLPGLVAAIAAIRP